MCTMSTRNVSDGRKMKMTQSELVFLPPPLVLLFLILFFEFFFDFCSYFFLLLLTMSIEKLNKVYSWWQTRISWWDKDYSAYVPPHLTSTLFPPSLTSEAKHKHTSIPLLPLLPSPPHYLFLGLKSKHIKICWAQQAKEDTVELADSALRYSVMMMKRRERPR